MSLYSRRDVFVLAYVAGLLSGMVVAFASCSSDDVSAEHEHVTSGAH